MAKNEIVTAGNQANVPAAFIDDDMLAGPKIGRAHV